MYAVIYHAYIICVFLHSADGLFASSCSMMTIVWPNLAILAAVTELSCPNVCSCVIHHLQH